MTMFIQIQDGQPIGHAVVEENLKALFPSTVFPAIYTPEFVEQFGYGMYEWTQIPEVQYPNKLVELAPTKRDNGIYYQTWGTETMTASEQAEATTHKVDENRMMRNMRLMQSDWTQLSDVSLSAEKKAAWNAYRQALRDVTAQAGFPWTIDWPTQPE
jgi:hypothetical protein